MDIENFNEAHEAFRDPRFQRRVVKVRTPIAIVGNMFDVTLECKHAPLMFRDTPIRVGEAIFCPGCYKEPENDCKEQDEAQRNL